LINIAGYGIQKLRRWLSLTGGAPGHAGNLPVRNVVGDLLERYIDLLYKI
jgi:hypothetical protein